MKVNSGQAPSTLIPEYVGSDFDAVLEVASNINAVLEVVSNIEAVKAVAAHKTATELADGFMSSADKIKLDGIAAGANNYTHPVSAVTAGTYKSVSVDVNGHITAGTNPTTLAGFGITDGVPLSHVGAGGTAHSEASTSVAGFMSAADKTKLDGIAAGANAYVHPTGDGNLHVPITGTGSDGYVLKAGATAGSLKWAAISKTDAGLSNVDNTSDLDKPVSTATANALSDKAPISHVGSVGEEHHGLASQAIAGFMSPTDKIKLDNITGVTAVTGVSSVNNKTGEVALTKADVGLGLVNNTADLAKPVSTATQTALDAKADTNHVHEAVADLA